MQSRFGIGEWFGKPLELMSVEERRELANVQLGTEKRSFPCPFQSRPSRQVACNKPGGVCSLRLYERNVATGQVRPAEGEPGRLRTICPLRFEEGAAIYRWVGETVLGCVDPLAIGEVGFLESPTSEGDGEPPSGVGRIDKVLVVPDSKPLSWCALEVQAVYFEGRAMRFDFAVIREQRGHGLPFPEVLRRPDYRSSGPKRLMPQLQPKGLFQRRLGGKAARAMGRGSRCRSAKETGSLPKPLLCARARYV